jgi:hypothetical protein
MKLAIANMQQANTKEDSGSYPPIAKPAPSSVLLDEQQFITEDRDDGSDEEEVIEMVAKPPAQRKSPKEPPRKVIERP